MTNFKMVLSFLLIGFSTLLASTAEELAHEGEVAFYHQNYIEARKSLIPASQQGDLQSLYYLGILALRGYGTPVDYKEAIRIFREGSQKGHPESQVALAILMIEGIGTPQDYLKASVLLTKAAKQGISDAQLLLGWLFRNGIGVKKNKTISYALWNYVAAQGNDWARINRDAVLYELSEPELYRGQELSSNLPKLWNLISAEHTKMNKYLRKNMAKVR